MGDLKDFRRRMVIHADKLGQGVTRVVRKTALVADQAVVTGTPVDTGRARSNWITRMGEAEDSTIDPYSPGEGGSTGPQNTQAAIEQCQRVVASYQLGGNIHITNNLPYIQRLNDGHSQQAPANFVETAVLEAVEAVKKEKVLNG